MADTAWNGRKEPAFGFFISLIGTMVLIGGFFYTIVISPLRDDVREIRADVKIIQETVMPRSDVDKLLADQRAEFGRLIGELNEKIKELNANCVGHRK